jgi:hypothetical protein
MSATPDFRNLPTVDQENLDWSDLPWDVHGYLPELGNLGLSERQTLFRTLKALEKKGGIKLESVEYIEEEGHIVVETIEDGQECFYALCLKDEPDYRAVWVSAGSLQRAPWFAGRHSD